MASLEDRMSFPDDYADLTFAAVTDVSIEAATELDSFATPDFPAPRAPEPEAPPKKSVTILVPALNEEDGIVRVVGNLPLRMIRRMGLIPRVLVVDGNSTDRTREYAEALGADIFVQRKRGKGAALREVIPTLASDYVVMIDGDGTYPVEDIPAFVRHLESGVDVISGSRLAGTIENRAMSSTHRIGNRLLTGIANTLYRPLKTTDMCTGLWGFRTDALKSFALTSNGFDLEADLFSETALQGFRYAEVPIRYKKRAGHSKLSWKAAVRIGWTLLRKRFTRRAGTRAPARPSHA
jgi:dolichol-phosphate mannosyltransferase